MTEYKQVPVVPTDSVLCLLNEIVNFRALDKATDYDLKLLNRAIEIIIESKASPAHDGEAVAWLHTVRDAKAREGDTDLALSFDDHSFPLDSIGWVSVKAQPLFTAPPRVADEAMVLRAAKVLADRSAKECNVDPDDNWNVYSETYIADAEQALKAAIGES